MRKSSSIGAVVVVCCGTCVADTVSEQQTIQHTYPVTAAAPHLLVRNIWGNVTVRAGTSDAIVVTVDERRSAPTREWLEQSKAQVRLATDATKDGATLIVGNPNTTTGRTELCRGCRVEYQFEIAVPQSTQLDVSTVTDGRIEVHDVRGTMSASNVNGPVSINGVNDCTSVESVNGALDVVFARAPSENCTLKTINGEIRVGLPANAGLDAVLSVGHGKLESEFDVEPIGLPTQLEKDERVDGFSYRLQQRAGVRLGAGGPTFTFASLNGDVRILRNK